MVTWKRFPESLFMRLSFAWSYGVHPPANDLNRFRFATRGPYCRAQRLRHPAHRPVGLDRRRSLSDRAAAAGRSVLRVGVLSKTTGFPSKTHRPRLQGLRRPSCVRVPAAIRYTGRGSMGQGVGPHTEEDEHHLPGSRGCVPRLHTSHNAPSIACNNKRHLLARVADPTSHFLRLRSLISE